MVGAFRIGFIIVLFHSATAISGVALHFSWDAASEEGRAPNEGESFVDSNGDTQLIKLQIVLFIDGSTNNKCFLFPFFVFRVSVSHFW